MLILERINNWEILRLTPGISEDAIREFIRGTDWVLADIDRWDREVSYYTFQQVSTLWRAETGVLLAKRSTLQGILFEIISPMEPVDIVLKRLS